MRAWYARRAVARATCRRSMSAGRPRCAVCDDQTPIMLDGGFYAAADSSGTGRGPSPIHGFCTPIACMAMGATSAPNMKREMPFRYPGDAPFGEAHPSTGIPRESGTIYSNPSSGRGKIGVPVSRMVAAEFGCVRRWPDCPQYLEDVITSSRETASTGRSIRFAESGTGSTTSSAPANFHGSTGKRRRRASPYELHAGQIPSSIHPAAPGSRPAR